MKEASRAGRRLSQVAVLGSVFFIAVAQGQTHEGAAVHTQAKPSTVLQVVSPEATVTVSPDDVRHLPQVSVTVHNAHTGADERYAGAKLTDLLAKAGVKPGKDALRSYVAATGSDGYWVLFSGEEISDLVHDGTVLVATDRDGRPLGADGAFKLISTEDNKPERWVRNLQSIQWVRAKP